MSRFSVIRVSACAVALALAAGCGSNAPTAPAPAVNGSVPVSANPGSDSNGAGAIATANTGAITVPAGGGTNYTCSDLAAQYAPGAEWIEVKLDQAPNGAHTVADNMLSAGITNGTRLTFDWTANRGVDAVFVKSGSAGHSLYLYSTESTGATGLTTPTGQDISHVSFCYDVELLVSKTAATSFTRDYDWTIAKSVDQPSITLANGAQTAVNYTVAASKDAGTDSDWAVSGTLIVTNPHTSLTAAGISVESSLANHGAIAVSCPLGSLAPQASMTCSYGPVSLANGSARTNTGAADSSTYGIVRGEGAAAVSFVAPTTVRDNAVNVTDSYSGAAVLATGLTASRAFTYPRPVQASQLACGANTLSNTASLATDDGAMRTASVNVTAMLDCSTAAVPPPPPAVPPTAGCTLTQGYWGTHSSKGPAKYDATWALVGENTPFYQSGASYYGVLQLPTKGNAYYQLAHQFIAAKLNILKGAAAPAGFDMAAADAFFTANTPAQIAALKGSSPLRAQALAWAATLDSYNNGLLNAPHCS